MIALLSNPHASGNSRLLPRLSAWAARQEDIRHEVVERVEDIGPALARAAALKPDMLVLNGGDGTARAFLSELYHGDYFADVPPVAVLPSGKTNLIAIDLGAGGDALATLKKLVARHREARGSTVVNRSLLALFTPGSGNRPVLGLFVGGAGLAETILYCRRRLYPTGLPNALCHALAAVIALFAVLTGGRFGWSPVRERMRLSAGRTQTDDRFFVLLVTTLERLLLGVDMAGGARDGGGLKMIAIDSRPRTLLRTALALLTGRFGKSPLGGVTVHGGDEVRIEGRGSLILDGESYRVPDDGALVLRSTAPMPFVSLA